MKKEKITKIINISIILLLISSITTVGVMHINNKNQVEKYQSDIKDNNTTPDSSNNKLEETKTPDVEFDNIKEITYDELHNVLKKNKNSIIFITKDTCMHCARFKLELNSALNKTKKEAYMIEVNNLDDEQKELLGDRFDIIGTPTTVITDKEAEKAKISGFKPSKDVVEWINENIK